MDGAGASGMDADDDGAAGAMSTAGMGSAGTDAMAAGRDGDDGEAGSDSEPSRPIAPGSAYGPCRDNGQCNGGLFCTSSGGSGGPSYCAPTCTQNGTGFASCPQPESGNVTAVCAVAFCVLLDCAELDCPTGMSCMKQAELSGFPSSVCAYP
jgi:hypothetical protein